MSLDIRPIEDAIVAALLADATLVSMTRHIGSYAGNFKRARAKGYVLVMPAVLVWYQGGPTVFKSGARFEHTAKFGVSLVVRNLRGDVNAQGGASDSEPGVYDLVPEVMRILAGQTLALDISELLPGEIAPVLIDEATGDIQYDLEFSTRVLFEKHAVPVNLESIHIAHHLPTLEVATDVLDDLQEAG